MPESPTLAASGTQTTVVTARSVADMVTASSTLITSVTAAFVSGDQNRIVSGSSDLVVGSYLATISSGTNALLNIAATGTHTGQTLNITDEFWLFDTTGAGVFCFMWIRSNMAAGTCWQLRVYQMMLTGGVRRVAYYQQYTDAQAADDMIKISAR